MPSINKIPSALPFAPRRVGGHTFNLITHTAEAAYRRGGLPCYLCHARKKLIYKKPEEDIRQAFMQFLLREVGVPAHCIEAEVPMSHFQARAAGRADIIVYDDQPEESRRPVAIVECKESSRLLIDAHFEQAARYNTILQTGFVIITNGYETEIWRKIEDIHQLEGNYQLLKQMPTYAQLMGHDGRKLRTASVKPYVRPVHSPLRKAVVRQYLSYHLGESTNAALHSFVINLAGFLLADQQRAPRYHNRTKGIYSIVDQGIRKTSFGNASGGTWTGEYRYFIVNTISEDQATREDQIVSISVFAKGKRKNDSTVGTISGDTMLCVAVDAGEKSHHSLQLALDRFTLHEGNNYTIWHNGRLTNGAQGSVKSSEVLEFVKLRAPDLFDRDNQLILGRFDNTEWITWEQPNARKFIANLIRYALLRDEFRHFKGQA